MSIKYIKPHRKVNNTDRLITQYKVTILDTTLQRIYFQSDNKHEKSKKKVAMRPGIEVQFTDFFVTGKKTLYNNNAQ